MHDTPPPIHPTDSAQPSALTGLRRQRLQQVLWFLIGGFGLVALINLATGHYTRAGLQGLIAGALGWAAWLNARNQSRTAAQWTLGIFLAALIGLSAKHAPLLGDVPTAYACVLILASMFESRRPLLVTAGVLLASIAGLFVLYAMQAAPGVSLTPELGKVGIAAVIIVVTTAFLAMLSTDIRNLLARLEQENAALTASNARVTQLAYHDSLTSLPNRTQA